MKVELTFDVVYRSLGRPGDEAKLRKWFDLIGPDDPKAFIRNVVEAGIFPHVRGNWCKKIDYRQKSLGSWKKDPNGDEAVKRLRELQNGHEIKPAARLTLTEAVNHFLHAKERLIPDELAQVTWNRYRGSCAKLLDYLPGSMAIEDVTPSHFGDLREHMAKTVAVTTLKNQIIEIRMLFRWANESGLITGTVKFGNQFAVPKKAKVQKHLATQPTKLYRADQIMAIMNEAGTQMAAKILLCINCGYGPTDLSELRLDAIDLDAGLIGCEPGLLAGMVALGKRGKTSIPRGAALWPETTLALRTAIDQRPAPQVGHEHLAFLNPAGRQWCPKKICTQFKSVRCFAGVERGGLYWLRHTFETVSRGAKDQQATNCVMGHSDGSMADVYTHGIDKQRLVDVAEFVRQWLLGEKDENHKGPY